MFTSIAAMSRRILRFSFALSAFFILTAFRHTDVEGYTDPAYAGYTFQNVVIQLPNASLTFKKHVLKQLNKRLKKYKIRMIQHDDLFAPTREWSEEASREIYQRHNIDAGIVITLGNSGSETTPGAVLYNASTVGGTTTGYATQIQLHFDHASFEIALVDIATQDTVWIGSLDTRGAGLMFTGAKSTAKGLVKGLMREWRSAGHLQRR